MNFFGPISADTLTEIASGEQTVLFLCKTAAGKAGLDALFDDLSIEQPRLHLVSYIARAPENDLDGAIQFNDAGLTKFCKLRRVRSAYLTDEYANYPQSIADVLTRQAIPMFGLSEGANTIKPLNNVAERFCAVLLKDDAAKDVSGVAREELASFIVAANGLRNIREKMKERGLLMRLAGSAQDKLRRSKGRILSAPGVNRIQSNEALAEKLDYPRTIVCLGNGPSSEHEELAALDYDCMFRVNATWLERGFMMDPDVVFCGSAAAMKDKRLSNAIVGAGDATAERRLLKERMFYPQRWPLSYFATNEMERFTVAFYEKLSTRTEQRFPIDWYPTNGARMLAVAAALKPDRLIVAGIDLFAHPRGAYAGRTNVPNSYAAQHDRDLECEFIFSVFDQFDGELIILSEVLLDRWKAQRSRQ